MGGENKKNEPQFQMKIEPLNLTKRLFSKVKTTSNDMFRLRPPLGFVGPNESVTISVIYTSKEIPPNGHYFVFYNITAKDDDKKPRSLWTSSTNPEGVRRIIAEFVKEDAPAAADKNTPAPAESKDAPPKDAAAEPKDAPGEDAKDAAAKDAPAKDAESKDPPAKDAKEADEQEKEKEKE
uniref:Major sperm protein n=1 Tax=Panagrolaimus davidi TaxID=227884 RepID=A0A914QD10_9BILA